MVELCKLFNPGGPWTLNRWNGKTLELSCRCWHLLSFYHVYNVSITVHFTIVSLSDNLSVGISNTLDDVLAQSYFLSFNISTLIFYLNSIAIVALVTIAIE